MTAVLHITDIVKSYDTRPALDGVTLALHGDAYVSLLGPSGSGKTTLLRIIAGFEQPDSGEIRFHGQPMNGVQPHLRGIGFVFQNFALFPHLTVAQNVAFGLENRAVDPLRDRKVLSRRVDDMIGLVGLRGLEDRAISQISGGQKQRVALARTLVTEPKMVLLDEPLGALDAHLRLRMRAELRSIRERCGVTFLHVTGSETEALAMGDTVLVLERARIAQHGKPDTIYNEPASPEVARFLNCYNLLPGRASGGDFETTAGRLAIGGLTRPSRNSVYAIRFDRISIRPAGVTPTPGETSIEGKFIASEYTGSAVNSFFSLSDGSIFEVEQHLSHSAPETFAVNTPYRLSWKVEDAIVFA